MPTAQRAPTALLVRRGGERLLFDCAEGTQRQLLTSSIGLVDLREVFVTHFHADHYLGLPGMLKTFALRGRELPITIYGPRGLRDLFGSLRRIFGKLTYEYELLELVPGDVLERGEYRLEAFAVAHGVSAIGYSLDERQRARETAHSTAIDAAEIARDAGVAMLALTHLSNRYFGPEVVREAREVFAQTVVPKDFDIIDLRFEERGGPLLVKGGALHRRRETAPAHEAVPIGEESS